MACGSWSTPSTMWLASRNLFRVIRLGDECLCPPAIFLTLKDILKELKSPSLEDVIKLAELWGLWGSVTFPACFPPQYSPGPLTCGTSLGSLTMTSRLAS